MSEVDTTLTKGLIFLVAANVKAGINKDLRFALNRDLIQADLGSDLISEGHSS